MKYVMIGAATKKMNLCSAHGATLAGVEHRLLIALNGGHKNKAAKVLATCLSNGQDQDLLKMVL